jgi:PhnB protein
VNDLYPFLAVRDVAAAKRFYEQAFGAKVVEEFGDQVAVLEIAGRPVGLAVERPDLQTPSPETVGGTTVRISLHVDDPDGAAAKAIDAGATEMFPVEDQPYGMRQGRVVDPFGHHWLIGKPLQ